MDKQLKAEMLHELLHGSYLSMQLFETAMDKDTYINVMSDKVSDLVEEISDKLYRLYQTLGEELNG